MPAMSKLSGGRKPVLLPAAGAAALGGLACFVGPAARPAAARAPAAAAGAHAGRGGAGAPGLQPVLGCRRRRVRALLAAAAVGGRLAPRARGDTGHPENFETAGIEVTTGPLGMGVSNAVGLAAAEAHNAAVYNKPGLPLIDHYTYCIMGDGCCQEGISHESCAYAGHLGLGKLIVFYDDNGITIDGHTELSFTEDVGMRYEAYGWQVLTVEDGNTDVAALRKAIADAKACTDKPTLIKVKTVIGYGSPNKADSHDGTGRQEAGCMDKVWAEYQATRLWSQDCLNALASTLPDLIGGSADLAPSNMTLMKCTGDFRKDSYEGRNMRFGIREFGMGAVCNAISLHKTAIETIPSLRMIPDLTVIRPADGNETSGAYKIAFEKSKLESMPTFLALTRQAVPNLPNSSIENVEKGAYTVVDPADPELILVGTGSEVGLCMEAAKEMSHKKIRVVSMPSWELFRAQPASYKDSVLPKGVPTLSVEAACTMGWEEWATGHIGINCFGASAPGGTCLDKFGFNVPNVVYCSLRMLKGETGVLSDGSQGKH
ncbi:unnamed protein product [Prorocentrum cordatum]|uniref:Transketolase-like pyrimidine-binding domain-containing protein n=1 Tax=Prorocentrum cordatum TaxID=2364126 RepID=A0ABN9RM32_9DINO|nr:unnamed protein product [Polarella glacialis]